VIYPKGGHALEEQAGDRNRRIFEWFEKYISIPPTPAPTPTVATPPTTTPPIAPTLSVTPTATPIQMISPTATPTSVPATEAPEEPGFEGVFAIAGLLAVAYLLRRK